MKADKTFFIDFTNSSFNYFHNDILGSVVSKFLEANPDLLLSEVIKKDNLEEVIMEVLANNLENVINPNGLYHIIENIYDFWRDYKRYLFADLSVSYIINETNFHDVFNNFNKTILDAYRRVCLNLGKKFNIMRELPAGGNAFILLNRTNSYIYNELKDVPVKFEAGTPPIAEVIGLREAILYLESIGLDKIHEHEMMLKKKLVSELEKIDNIILYNKYLHK